MQTFFTDLRAALRAVRRRASFTSLAARMLALGLGFNTALFAVVKSVLLKPLPSADPARIAMLWTGRFPDGTGHANSFADFEVWQAQNHSFAALAAYNIDFGTLVHEGADAEEIGGATVSPQFFDVLQPRIVRGRGLAAGDDLADINGRPIVISSRLWREQFGLAPDIIGQSLLLNEHRRTIVGVLADDFVQPEPFWGEPADYWTPLIPEDRTNHAFTYLRVIGRLAPGATMQTAAADMDGIGRRLIAEFPSPGKQSVVINDIGRELGGDIRPRLWLFLGAVLLVLLLAIANVVNLTFARTSSRLAELTIRAALGASRARLASQLLLESTIVGIVGGLAGLAIAAAGIRVLLHSALSTAPGFRDVTVDLRVVAATVLMSTVVGALCGAAPAWRVARARLFTPASGVRTSSGLDVTRMRMWLVAAEMALAVPLLVGAMLLAVTLVKIQHVDPGFDAAHALQFRFSLPSSRYATGTSRIAFLRTLEDRLSALPGATTAGSVSSLPLGGMNNTGASVVYERPDGSLAQDTVGFRSTTGRYFAAIGVPLKRGRTFLDAPADAHTIVINEKTAHEFWGDLDPLGRRLRFGQLSAPDKQGEWRTVVGVVGDVHHEALTRDANTEIFEPYQDDPWGTMMTVVRTDTPSTLTPAVRRAVHDLDSHLALVHLGSAMQFVNEQLAEPRFGVLCATVFGVVGLGLAACGTFAVLSLLVAQRTREIGIRMALGATPRRVRSLMLRDALIPVGLGCAAGGLAAAWLVRGLTALLFEVTPLDPRVFAGTIATLVVTALVASWWPSRRAMRVDPVRALRAE